LNQASPKSGDAGGVAEDVLKLPVGPVGPVTFEAEPCAPVGPVGPTTSETTSCHATPSHSHVFIPEVNCCATDGVSGKLIAIYYTVASY
jgi:hypothetical protein